MPDDPSNTSGGDDSALTTEEELQCFKHLVGTLTEKVHKLESTKRQRSAAAVTSSLGRGIRRIVCLFGSLHDITLDYDLHALSAAGEQDDEDETYLLGLTEDQVEIVKRNWEHNHTAVQVLMQLIPNFQRTLIDSTPDELDTLFSKLERSANDARAHDTKELKIAIANWLNNGYTRKPSPPLDPDHRLNRGIQHDLTGYFLSPVELDWDDPQVRAAIRAGDNPDISLGSSFFCRFLYRKFNYCSGDIEEGFLRNDLLIKAYKHIFTSPASAKDVCLDDGDSDIENIPIIKSRKLNSQKSQPARHDVATLLHMKTVSARSIAYICVQVALSSAPNWVAEHEGFNYAAFYNFLVDYFEDVEGPESRKRTLALLAWWNRQIFPYSVVAVPRKTMSNSQKRLQDQRTLRETGFA